MTDVQITWVPTKVHPGVIVYKTEIAVPWKAWGHTFPTQEWEIVKWDEYHGGKCDEWCIYHPQCHRIVAREKDLRNAKKTVQRMVQNYIQDGGWELKCKFCGEISIWGDIENCPKCFGTWEEQQKKRLSDDYERDSGFRPGNIF